MIVCGSGSTKFYECGSTKPKIFATFLGSDEKTPNLVVTLTQMNADPTGSGFTLLE